MMAMNDMAIDEVSEALGDYVQTVRQFQKVSTLKNLHKQYMKTIRKRLQQKNHYQAKKLVDLIPQSSQTLNSVSMTDLLSKFLKFPLKRILIPETLISSNNKSKLYYTLRGQLATCSGKNALDNLFKLSRRHSKTTKYSVPEFVLKTTEKVSLLFSEEEAIEAIKNTENYSLTRFIPPPSNKMSKIRVHWKQNVPPEAYLISNKHQIPLKKDLYKGSIVQKQNTVSRKDTIDKLKGLLKFNTDEDSPFSSQDFPQTLVSMTTSVVTDKTPVKLTEKIDDDFKVYLLKEKYISSWNVAKLSSIDESLNSFVNNIVHVLNHSNIISSTFRAKELVIDFCRDSKKNWYLLEIPQVLSEMPVRSKSHSQSLNSQDCISLSQKIQKISRNLNRTISAVFDSPNKTTGEAKYRNIKRIRENIIKSLEFRVNKFRSFIDQNPKQETINKTYTVHDSIDFYKESRNIDFYGNCSGISIQRTHIHLQKFRPKLMRDSTLHTSAVHKKLESRGKLAIDCSLQGLKKIGIIKHKQKLKKDEMYNKYGGIQFVKQFVAALYHKFSKSEQLQETTQDWLYDKFVSVVQIYAGIFRNNLPFLKLVNWLREQSFGHKQFEEFSEIFRCVSIEFCISSVHYEIILYDLDKCFQKASVE